LDIAWCDQKKSGTFRYFEAVVYVTKGIIRAALWFLPFGFMIVLLFGS
jgi:hypothetical protein